MIDNVVWAISLVVIGLVGLVCGFVAGWHWREWQRDHPPVPPHVNCRGVVTPTEQPAWARFVDELERRA